MHARHCRQHVDEVPAHPDAGRVVMLHRVQEAVLGRQQTRRHARVQCKREEGEEVGEGQGAADGGKGVVGRGDVVVPGDEAR